MVQLSSMSLCSTIFFVPAAISLDAPRGSLVNKALPLCLCCRALACAVMGLLVCSNCKRWKNTLLSCACRQVTYCEKRCQQQHWEHCHKYVCPFASPQDSHPSEAQKQPRSPAQEQKQERRGNCIKTVAQVAQYPTHTALTFAEDDNDEKHITWVYGLVVDLVKLSNHYVPLIPLRSTELADRMQQTGCITTASSKQVSERVYGICILVAIPPETELSGSGYIACSAICFSPRTLSSLATGRNPRCIDTALLKQLKRQGATYPSSPDAFVFSLPQERAECVICLDRAATFRWHMCTHDTREDESAPRTGALVCTLCRDKLIRQAQEKLSTKKKQNGHVPWTRCVMCRTAGRLCRARHPLRT